MSYAMLQHTLHDESLHHYGRRYQITLHRVFPEKIQKPTGAEIGPLFQICAENRATLYKFFQEIELDAIMSLARRDRIFALLGRIGELIGEKRFDSLTREDVQELVTIVRQQPTWSLTTQNYHLKAFKRFMRFVGGGEDYPACVAWLKIREKFQAKIRKEDLISEEEMARMIQVNTNPMQRCLLALLWEGLRVGELGTLKCKNITFEGKEVFVSVKGKTGERTVLCISGASQIRQWLDQHPTRDPNDWLFLISSNYNKGKRLGYNSIRKTIIKAAQKAGIQNRHIHPHLFRHSSITDRRRKGMRQREASAFYGVSGQIMTKVYDHLADADVHNEIRRVLGMEMVTTKAPPILETKECHFCQKLNPHYSMNCLNCGNSLSAADAIQQKDQILQIEKQKNNLQFELNAMRSMMDELAQEMGKISPEKKAILWEKAKGGI